MTMAHIPNRPIDQFFPHVCPSDSQQAATKVLEEFDDVANSLKIRHFFVLGTCLGMVRDKGFIKGDHDIDVGVVCSNSELLALYHKLVKTGFIHGSNGTRHNFHLYKHKPYIMLDVFPLDPQEFKEFDTVTYHGRAYHVPHPVKEYLRRHYGNWRVKK